MKCFSNPKNSFWSVSVFFWEQQGTKLQRAEARVSRNKTATGEGGTYESYILILILSRTKLKKQNQSSQAGGLWVTVCKCILLLTHWTQPPDFIPGDEKRGEMMVAKISNHTQQWLYQTDYDHCCFYKSYTHIKLASLVIVPAAPEPSDHGCSSIASWFIRSESNKSLSQQSKEKKDRTVQWTAYLPRCLAPCVAQRSQGSSAVESSHLAQRHTAVNLMKNNTTNCKKSQINIFTLLTLQSTSLDTNSTVKYTLSYHEKLQSVHLLGSGITSDYSVT